MGQPREEREVPPVRSPLSPVRTYKGDVSETVRRQKESVASIVSAEETRRGEGGTNGSILPVAESLFLGFHTRTGAFFAATGILTALVGAGIFLFFFFRSPPAPEISPAAEALIFVNKERKIPIVILDRKILEGHMRSAIATEGLALNDMVAITFVRERFDADSKKMSEDVVPIGELLTALTDTMPPGFARALGKEYLYGIHSFGENYPFLIAKVDSYESAFGNLFDWGGRPVVVDLAALFNIKSFPPVAVNDFTDILIKNRDARYIDDAEGNPVLYYSFVDKETLVFTTNKTTFDEILNRLATPRRTLR